VVLYREGEQLAVLPPVLVVTLNSGGLVPFVGAGVSMAAPTSLPSAGVLASELVERGYGQEGDDLEQVAEWCWEHGDPLWFAKALPTADWHARQPNDCHMVVAELAAEQLIVEILTTNWDTMIEVALNRCGVPYKRIEQPADLAAAGGPAIQVIKLHGGIDTLNTIRARKSEVDSEGWAEEWAGSVFAVQLRSKSVLFAGYSGASRATTRTMERISAEASRSQPDWMVGRAPPDQVITQERTARLLEALGPGHGGYINMDALDFFRQLRQEVYPLLLARPKQHATTLLDSLLRPTDVAVDDVVLVVRQVSNSWKDAGQRSGQEALRQAVGATSALAYVPIVPNAREIGEYWAWVAMVTWAGAATFNGSTLQAEAAGAGGDGTQVVPVFCRPGGARRQAAAEALLDLTQTTASPSKAYIGIVVGGTGPFKAPTMTFSVSRGTPAPDVVRGGNVSVEWAAPEEVFNLAEQETPASNIAAAIRSHLSHLVPAADPAT
jgi:hypothetical protein